MKVGKYEYPNDVLDVVKINKQIKEEFKEFCKKKKIVKSKLIEEFYKTILIRHRDGSLDAAKANVTINISRSTQRAIKRNQIRIPTLFL